MLGYVQRFGMQIQLYERVGGINDMARNPQNFAHGLRGRGQA